MVKKIIFLLFVFPPIYSYGKCLDSKGGAYYNSKQSIFVYSVLFNKGKEATLIDNLGRAFHAYFFKNEMRLRYVKTIENYSYNTNFNRNNLSAKSLDISIFIGDYPNYIIDKNNSLEVHSFPFLASNISGIYENENSFLVYGTVDDKKIVFHSSDGISWVEVPNLSSESLNGNAKKNKLDNDDGIDYGRVDDELKNRNYKVYSITHSHNDGVSLSAGACHLEGISYKSEKKGFLVYTQDEKSFLFDNFEFSELVENGQEVTYKGRKFIVQEWHDD